MLFEDQYLTVEQQAISQLREKGSRFITYIIPVRSEQEIRTELDKLRKQYHDATHHCYAWALGPGRQAFRVNDDGEPSGTAGRPIYAAIQSAGLTNVLVVVIRYFGGTKLGVSGLLDAYRESARNAISQSSIVSKTITEYYSVDFDYSLMNDVMRIVKEEQVSIISNEFGMMCAMQIAIRRNDSAKVIGKLSKLNNLSVNYLHTS
jgi:uncharacterized YigZ family protein